jgi:hypothetical protein
LMPGCRYRMKNFNQALPIKTISCVVAFASAMELHYLPHLNDVSIFSF